MKNLHHLHGELLRLAIFVLQEIFKRSNIEERRERDEAASLTHVAPEHQVLDEAAHVVLRAVLAAPDALELPVVLDEIDDGVDERGVAEVFLILLDEAERRLIALEVVPRLNEEYDDEQCEEKSKNDLHHTFISLLPAVGPTPAALPTVAP